MRELTRDLRRRLRRPERSRRIDDVVLEELRAIVDHRRALDAAEELISNT